jgi:hypothetical protein
VGRRRRGVCAEPGAQLGAERFLGRGERKIHAWLCPAGGGAVNRTTFAS